MNVTMWKHCAIVDASFRCSKCHYFNTILITNFVKTLIKKLLVWKYIYIYIYSLPILVWKCCIKIFLRDNNQFHPLSPRVEAGKNTSTVIPESRKRRQKGNRISLMWDSASRPKRRLMKTYFWISLFKSHRITANYLIESNVILIANKEFKENPLLRNERSDISLESHYYVRHPYETNFDHLNAEIMLLCTKRIRNSHSPLHSKINIPLLVAGEGAASFKITRTRLLSEYRKPEFFDHHFWQCSANISTSLHAIRTARISCKLNCTKPYVQRTGLFMAPSWHVENPLILPHSRWHTSHPTASSSLGTRVVLLLPTPSSRPAPKSMLYAPSAFFPPLSGFSEDISATTTQETAEFRLIENVKNNTQFHRIQLGLYVQRTF
jgi:hypothetical protein